MAHPSVDEVQHPVGAGGERCAVRGDQRGEARRPPRVELREKPGLGIDLRRRLVDAARPSLRHLRMMMRVGV